MSEFVYLVEKSSHDDCYASVEVVGASLDRAVAEEMAVALAAEIDGLGLRRGDTYSFDVSPVSLSSTAEARQMLSIFGESVDDWAPLVKFGASTVGQPGFFEAKVDGQCNVIVRGTDHARVRNEFAQLTGEKLAKRAARLAERAAMLAARAEV